MPKLSDFDFPNEIIFYILNFIRVNDLYTLRLTSKQLKILLDEYIALKYKKMIRKNICNSEFLFQYLHIFRLSPFYKELSEKISNHLETTDEMILYTLTIPDITQLDYKKVEDVIRKLRQEIKERKAKSSSFRYQEKVLQQKINLKNSLQLSCLVMKRGMIKKKILEIKDHANDNIEQFNIYRNKACDEFKQNPSFTKLFNTQRTPYYQILFLFHDLDQIIRNKIKEINFAESHLFCNLAGACLQAFSFGSLDVSSVNFENADLTSVTIVAESFNDNLFAAQITKSDFIFYSDNITVNNLDILYKQNEEKINKIYSDVGKKIAHAIQTKIKDQLAQDNPFLKQTYLTTLKTIKDLKIFELSGKELLEQTIAELENPDQLKHEESYSSPSPNSP